MWISLFPFFCLPILALQRMAIIGAGIGGGSIAYYAQNFSNESFSIVAFERQDYIGGRLKHLVHNGQVLELGGDAWAAPNQYIRSLIKELNISVTPPMSIKLQSSPLIDVWNGNNFVGMTRLMAEKSKQTKNVIDALDKFILNVNENYYIRDNLMPNDGACKTIEQYMEAAQLNYYTKTKAQKFYFDQGVSALYQDNILDPWQRSIYGQELNGSNLFSSLASLTCLVGLQQCTEGNDELVKALFAKYKTPVSLSTSVTHITQSQKSFVIQFTTLNGTFKQEFDIVVLASPIEVLNITFVNLTFPPFSYRFFEHWYVTYVLAKGIDSHYFHVNNPNSSVSPFILTTNNASTLWVSIQYVVKSQAGDATYYKVFSKKNISSILKDLFVEIQWSYVQLWPYTFPRLIPMTASDYQPILFSPNLYYLNGMESVASAMETSVAAGRNIALLLTH